MYNSNIVIHEESRTESLGVTTLNVFCGQSVRFALNRHLKWGIREAEQQGSTDTERIVSCREKLSSLQYKGKMQNNFPNIIAQAKRNISHHLKTPENTKSPCFLESRNLRSSCQNITGRAVILPSPWEESLALQEHVLSFTELHWDAYLTDIEMMVTDSLLRGGKYLSLNAAKNKQVRDNDRRTRCNLEQLIAEAEISTSTSVEIVMHHRIYWHGSGKSIDAWNLGRPCGFFNTAVERTTVCGNLTGFEIPIRMPVNYPPYLRE
ncbi:hypothetical protein T06_14221 [Trichinella sp. T6]|nr:hypothetical protein T06_14221 [Trichinella sp. T6]